MHDPLPPFLAELTWRGLLQDRTPGLAERLRRGPIAGYVGFDPTARSLQVGNLVPVMLLAHLQRSGGKPVVVVGGGTGLIGDPSGRSAERPLLPEDAVAENVARQRRQFERFLDFGSGAAGAVMVDNAEWLRPLKLVEFLRDVGKHFTVAMMLQKESVKARLEEGISYTEFSYMLLQAYDFLHLYRAHRCELQMGGSDQWGNITAGIELIRRIEGGEAHGLSAPLITAASGAKFGKTEQGAVWLDPALTSPYRFYQFWINADDRDVEAHLRRFTFRPRAEIQGLMAEHRAKPGARTPHRALADELTDRVHGTDAARRAAEASAVLFGEREPEAVSPAAWEVLRAELPTLEIERSSLPIATVELVTRSGLAKSKGEARRLLSQNGVYGNLKPLAVDGAVGTDDLVAGRYFWLRRGKKTDAIVVTGPS
jgi:tyrosyl-tRNA synthetase